MTTATTDTREDLLRRRSEQRAFLEDQNRLERAKLKPAGERLKMYKVEAEKQRRRVATLTPWGQQGDVEASSALRTAREKFAAAVDECENVERSIREINRRSGEFEAALHALDAAKVDGGSRGDLEKVLAAMREER